MKKLNSEQVIIIVMFSIFFAFIALMAFDNFMELNKNNSNSVMPYNVIQNDSINIITTNATFLDSTITRHIIKDKDRYIYLLFIKYQNEYNFFGGYYFVDKFNNIYSSKFSPKYIKNNYKDISELKTILSHKICKLDYENHLKFISEIINGNDEIDINNFYNKR